MRATSDTYAESGVDTRKEDLAMELILPLFEETFRNRKGKVGESLLPIKHYAGIIKITNDIAVALKTDGVGTKTFITQYMDKYDTIGIDCIAMNVNDIICTGAEPTSFLDYLAVQKSDTQMIKKIAIGLKKGADIAHVNIVGGETAIVPEMINGVIEGKGYDLAGMCVGVINPKDIIDGSKLSEGDVVIGLSSSGIHSNGLTLARDVLFKKNNFTVNSYVEELGRTLGEELLEPTSIYVDEIKEMIGSGIKLKSLAHITSDGLLNLLRVGDNFGYRITNMPDPQPIFKLIQRYVPITEMYKVYNMGIGFCAVVPRDQCDSALQIAEKYGKKAFVMGEAVKDSERRIKIEPLKMIGYYRDNEFRI